ncbi:MAG: hypothetical protein WC026_10025 [Hyphomicrobium sp.]|uniref:hypothetical protein n=1 Tax=Hyphomicrobium sp. TaxID=82 RepID=UPI003568E29F
MRAVVTSAVARFAPQKRQQVSRAQFVGLAVASIVPAVIWCVLIDVVAMWISGPLSALTTVVIGVTIAVFLAIVCAPLILRDRR